MGIYKETPENSLPLSLFLSLHMHWGKVIWGHIKRWLSARKPSPEIKLSWTSSLKNCEIMCLWFTPPRLCILLCSPGRLIHSPSPGSTRKLLSTPPEGLFLVESGDGGGDQNWHFWDQLGSRGQGQEETVETYHKPSFSPGLTSELIHSIFRGKNKTEKRNKKYGGKILLQGN